MSSPDWIRRSPAAAAALLALLLPTGCERSQASEGPGKDGVTQANLPAPAGPQLGRPLSPAAERALDITIMPDGSGLPVGQGSVVAGAQLFEEQCAACHGSAGARGIGQIPALTGGVGSLTSAAPVRTVNSFWPYAPLVFDYVRRAMPPTAPNSLTADETYALVAYMLSVDGLVPASATLDRNSLSKVRMPNREGFVSAWPDK